MMIDDGGERKGKTLWSDDKHYDGVRIYYVLMGKNKLYCNHFNLEIYKKLFDFASWLRLFI